MSEGRDILEPAQWPQRNDKRVAALLAILSRKSACKPHS
jgi:hypothetical protein